MSLDLNLMANHANLCELVSPLVLHEIIIFIKKIDVLRPYCYLRDLHNILHSICFYRMVMRYRNKTGKSLSSKKTN